MGNYLGWAGAWVAPEAGVNAVEGKNLKHFWLGTIAWCAGAAIFSVASQILQDGIMALPRYLSDAPHGPAVMDSALAALLMGLAIKPLLAWATLPSEVQAVELALGESLQAGHERLG